MESRSYLTSAVDEGLLCLKFTAAPGASNASNAYNPKYLRQKREKGRKGFKKQAILIYRSMEFTFINRNAVYRHCNRYFLIRFPIQYTVTAESTSFVTCSSSPRRSSATRNNACGRTDHRHLTFKWRYPRSCTQTRRVLIVSSYDRKVT
jgi:hypothetical protein